jgi:predicted nucleic acid-binding protein
MKTKIAFWDTSAIVPLCVKQQATTEVRRIRRQFPTSVLWWGAPVELRSALARLLRDGKLEVRGCGAALQRWRDIERRGRTINPSEPMLELAAELPDKYGLRTLDAFQLAAALIWCDGKARNRAFVCADSRLSAAASNAGFMVVSVV